ncbi:hypothetical protein M5K25_011140 [Dendrobium thyrsiflorum]|uniref:Uncharacterized protein n=1 Tax=Dendrobium thyrsiflorum TaxID=117978 RepID=A0ABD0V926_DENTH
MTRGPLNQMELQNTPMTVQLGQGVRIQLANAIIETGNVGATIQFGSLDFPAAVVRTVVVPVSDMNTGKPARRLHPFGAPTHRTHLPAQRPAAKEPSRRTSVFERLSQSEVPTIKRTLAGGRISVVSIESSAFAVSIWSGECQISFFLLSRCFDLVRRTLDSFFALYSLFRSGQMELQNTPMTVQLGQGVRIQLANAIIETGNVGATIQFGSLDFPAAVARTVVVPVSDMNTGKPARRLHPFGAPTHRTHLPAQRPAAEEPSRRTSVFERLSQSEVPTIKRTLAGGRISVVTANTTSRPTGLSLPREYDPETSTSGGRLTRRQRIKRNAELWAQQ